MRASLTLLLGLFSLSAFAAPDPAPGAFSGLGLPSALSKPRLQALLQGFVDRGWGRSFRRLGDERDFDHGHVLVDSRTRAPVAILYHTQELAFAQAAAKRRGLDAGARNWIQWLDGRGIEDARLYVRDRYPRSGSWDWFVARELPGLKRRGTITDKMLDPARLGAELTAGRQWTFTRVACGTDAPDPASNVIRIALPDRTAVCLALGAS